MDKLILVMINHPPRGSRYFAEGLRTAMGLIASTDEMRVAVVFLGEGVLGALRDADRSEASRSIATLAEWGFGLKAERESLTELELSADAVAADVEIIPRARVLELIRVADHTLDF